MYICLSLLAALEMGQPLHSRVCIRAEDFESEVAVGCVQSGEHEDLQNGSLT